MRFATNPGPSPTTTAVLPSAVRAETTLSTTRGSVEPIGITSTQGTSSGGTNQWTPRNRPGRRSVSASCAIGIDDVFVAITASAAAAASISAYAAAFTSGRSKTASTIRSAPPTASAIDEAAREVALRRRGRAVFDASRRLEAREELDGTRPGFLGQLGRGIDERRSARRAPRRRARCRRPSSRRRRRRRSSARRLRSQRRPRAGPRARRRRSPSASRRAAAAGRARRGRASRGRPRRSRARRAASARRRPPSGARASRRGRRRRRAAAPRSRTAPATASARNRNTAGAVTATAKPCGHEGRAAVARRASSRAGARRWDRRARAGRGRRRRRTRSRRPSRRAPSPCAPRGRPRRRPPCAGSRRRARSRARRRGPRTGSRPGRAGAAPSGRRARVSWADTVYASSACIERVDAGRGRHARRARDGQRRVDDRERRAEVPVRDAGLRPEAGEVDDRDRRDLGARAGGRGQRDEREDRPGHRRAAADRGVDVVEQLAAVGREERAELRRVERGAAADADEAVEALPRRLARLRDGALARLAGDAVVDGRLDAGLAATPQALAETRLGHEGVADDERPGDAELARCSPVSSDAPAPKRCVASRPMLSRPITAAIAAVATRRDRLVDRDVAVLRVDVEQELVGVEPVGHACAARARGSRTGARRPRSRARSPTWMLR